MAKYCDEIFGELLLKEPLKEVHLLPGVPLPSPNQLKGKRLILSRVESRVEKAKVVASVLGDRIDLIPCRGSYFALGRFEE